MKRHYIIIIAAVFGVSAVFGVHTAFGRGGGDSSGGGGSTLSNIFGYSGGNNWGSGGGCDSNCNNVVSTDRNVVPAGSASWDSYRGGWVTSSGSNSSSNNGNSYTYTPTPTPSTVLPCDLTALNKTVQAGTPVVLNWTPASKAGVPIKLERDGTTLKKGNFSSTNQTLAVPNGVSTYTDTGITSAGTYNYILSYSDASPAPTPGNTRNDCQTGSSWVSDSPGGNDGKSASISQTSMGGHCQPNTGVPNQNAGEGPKRNNR